MSNPPSELKDTNNDPKAEDVNKEPEKAENKATDKHLLVEENKDKNVENEKNGEEEKEGSTKVESPERSHNPS